MSNTKRKLFSEWQVFWCLLTILTIVHACGKNPISNEPQPQEPPPPTPTANTKPEIISFSPARGVPGTEVTITGKNFKDNVLQNNVRFPGSITEAFVSTATTTQLKVKVPQDATTGKIIVKVDNLSDTTDTAFIVDPAVTAITGFSPQQGPFGTEVTLTGIQFGNNIKVKLNGVEAKVSSRSTTRIIFKIPVNTNLTAHKITLLSDNDSLGTVENFTVTAPGPYARWEYKNVSLFPDGVPAYFHGLSFVYQNKIYWGFTGMGFNETFADYVVYDPTQPNKEWIYQGQLPAELASPEWKNAVAIVHDNKVYIGTGIIGSGFSTKWWEFHPDPVNQSNTYTRLTDFPKEAYGAVAFILNNNMYVGFGAVNKELYRFDPTANNNKGNWVQAANAPFSELNSGGAVVLNNAAYFGRALEAPLQSRHAFYKYTAGGAITRMTDLPEDLPTFFTPTFTISNKGYFAINRNLWEYTPDGAGGTWRAVIGADNAQVITTPTIIQTAVLTINGAQVVYGWNPSGRLYELKFN